MAEIDNTQQAGAQPAAQPQPQHPTQGRPCPKDCRKCPMAQQICCASMLSFQMYDVLNSIIQRVDAQSIKIAELSARLSAIQSSEAEFSEPAPIQGDLFQKETT